MALTAGIRREQAHSQSSITAEDRSMITTTVKAMSGSVQKYLRADGLARTGIPNRPKKTTPAGGRRGRRRGLEWCRGGRHGLVTIE
jgi:hypothetical protein